MKTKRVLAFFLDMILVYFIANIIFMTCFKTEYEKFVKSSDEYTSLIKSTISQSKESNDKEKLIEDTNKISYSYLKASSTETIIVLTIEIAYFVFAQYFNKGQTIGKKLMKIRIKQLNDDKLNAGLFVLRESILFVIPIQIINYICLLSTKMNTYLTINSITSNIQTIIYLTIIAFMIFRSDNRGLHEILSQTEVTAVEKKEI